MPHSLAAQDGKLAVCHGSTLKFGTYPELSKSVEVPAVPQISTKDAESNYFDLVKFSPCGKYIAAVDHFGKSVHVYDENLELVSSRQFPKRPSAIEIAKGNLYVGDKFGDLYKVAFLSKEPVLNEKGVALIEPVLGHVSMLLAVAAYGEQIITSDRDEHIKISSMKNPFVIDNYLFGHEEYVSQLLVAGDLLVSGGGDSYLKSWDLKTGKQMGQFDLKHYAEDANEVNVSALSVYEDSLLVLLLGSTKLIRLQLSNLEFQEVIETSFKLTALSVNGSVIYASSAEKIMASSLPWAPKDLELGPSSVPLFTQGSLRKQPEH